MFLETLIATFALGMIAGAILIEVLRVQPARRETYTTRTRLIRSQGQLLEASRPHRGTPYRRRTPDEITYGALLNELIDNTDHSKHADARNIVSLPRPRVQTGRPV